MSSGVWGDHGLGFRGFKGPYCLGGLSGPGVLAFFEFHAEPCGTEAHPIMGRAGKVHVEMGQSVSSSHTFFAQDLLMLNVVYRRHRRFRRHHHGHQKCHRNHSLYSVVTTGICSQHILEEEQELPS